MGNFETDREAQMAKAVENENLAKQWSKIDSLGTDFVPRLLQAMGYKSVAVTGYSEATKKLLAVLKDSVIKVNVCLDLRERSEVTDVDGFTVYDDISEMLKKDRADLIIDADEKKYKVRKYMYDDVGCESCTLKSFLIKVNGAEFFKWYALDNEFKNEMLDDFCNLISERYKNLAIYGESEFIDNFAQTMSTKIRGELIRIKNDEVSLKDSGRMFEISKYQNEAIDGIFYIGICSEVMFVKRGKRVDAINVNSICKELAMSFDLAHNVLPKLKEKGVKVMTFLYPELYTLNTMLSARGKQPFKRKPFYHNMVNDHRYTEDIKKFFGPFYSDEYAKGILERPSAIEVGGVRRYVDFHNKFYNTFDGHRVTTNCPQMPKHTIHMFGKCVAMGRYVEDMYTIASQLQRYINDKFGEFRVINYGIEADTEINKKLKFLHYKDGDIVLIVYRYYEVFHRQNNNVQYLSDIIIDLSQEHREYFLDTPEHFNYVVNGAIAERIFNTIEGELKQISDSKLEYSNKFFSIEEESDSEEAYMDMYPGLKQYIEELSSQRVLTSGRIGAIVMNCNPFTLGHKYLIEQARQKCDLLYIFVVEEDKSIFSFEDRFELVKQGTQEFDNVKVMPSGSFMISTVTFPEYFNKDTPSEVKIDTSNDVTIFGRYIAPALGISVRFAGEEPLDVVTNQYNETMSSLLPQFGISFDVIPRKESNGKVISASRVRACIRVKNFVEIRDIVPETTFRYLVKRFG